MTLQKGVQALAAEVAAGVEVAGGAAVVAAGAVAELPLAPAAPELSLAAELAPEALADEDSVVVLLVVSAGLLAPSLKSVTYQPEPLS